MDNQLLSELVGGALTGYITNSIAIKMLFKKYGPFGGVILKTRGEFIQNIGALVERDLINAHTLKKELHKEEIKQLLEKMAADLFAIHLPLRTRNLALYDFPDISKTYNNLLIHYKEDLAQYTEEFIRKVLTEVQFNQLLNSKQLAYFVRAIFEKTILYLKENKLLLTLYQKNKDKKITEILPLNNLSEVIDYPILKIIKENQDNLEQLFYILYKQLQLPELLTRLIKQVRKDITPELEKTLIGLPETIIETLKKSDRTLQDILGNKFFEQLENELTPLISEFLLLFSKKEPEIKRILEECLERAFKAENKSFTLKIILKRLMINSLKKGYRNQEILKFFFNTTDTRLLEKEFASKITLFLKEKTPAELISRLEEKTEIIYIIKEKIRKGIKTLLMKETNLPEVLTEQLPGILWGYFQDELLLDQKFTNNHFFEKGLGSSKYFAEVTLGNLLSENSVQGIANLLIEGLKRHQERIEDKLITILQKKNQNLVLTDDLINHLSSSINEAIITLLEEKKDNFLAIKMDVLSTFFKQRQKSPKRFASKLSGFLNDNLHLLLEGQVSEIIAANLERVPDNELQKTIEEFMGRELKPITLLGGLLGMLSGGLLFVFKSRINPSFNYSLLLSAGIYGLIGYLTNVIAIKMVFRPYQEKRFLGLKLPFTPGVVAREKDRFSRALGQFIDEELLNNKNITPLLHKKRNKIQQQLANYLLDKDYRMIKKVILLNRENIGRSCKGLLLNYSRRSIRVFLKKIPQTFSNRPFSKDLFLQKSYSLKAELLKQAAVLKNTDRTLADILPDLDIYLKMLFEIIIDKAASKINSYKETKEISPVNILQKIGPIIIEKWLAANWKKMEVANLLQKLKADRSKLQEYFKARIKASWGFWYSAGQIFDLDYTLELFIDELLDYGLPELLDICQADLGVIVSTKLPEPGKFIFEILNTDREPLIEDLINRVFPKYLELITGELGYILQRNKEQIAITLTGFTAPVIYKYIENKKLREMLSRIPEQEIAIIVDEIFSSIEQNPLSNSLVDNYIHYLLEKLCREGLETFFDLDLLANDLQRLYREIENNEQLDRQLLLILSKAIEETAGKLEQLIERNTLEAISRLVINSFLDNLEDNLPELLDQIDIAQIIEDEVKQMKTAEIEELFYSFAGKYLTNLERYGWLGSLMGLLNSLLK